MEIRAERVVIVKTGGDPTTVDRNGKLDRTSPTVVVSTLFIYVFSSPAFEHTRTVLVRQLGISPPVQSKEGGLKVQRSLL